MADTLEPEMIDETVENSPEPATVSAWRWVFIGAALVLAGVLITLAALLLTSSVGSGNDVLAMRDRPPKGTPFVDALVLRTAPGRLDLRQRTGKKVTLYVREPDRPYIDVQHAQSHAALGQPVRVYHATKDGRKIAIFLEDSPLIF